MQKTDNGHGWEDERRTDEEGLHWAEGQGDLERWAMEERQIDAHTTHCDTTNFMRKDFAGKKKKKKKVDNYARSIFVLRILSLAWRTLKWSLSLSCVDEVVERSMTRPRGKYEITASMSLTLRLSSLYLAWYLASSAPAAMPMGPDFWCFWRGGTVRRGRDGAGEDMMAVEE